MADLRVCSAAETEFTDALCWYAKQSRVAALEFESEFDRSLERIAEYPDRYPQMDSRHRFYLMRRFPYQIIYRWTGESITIVALAHTSRRPAYWTNR